MNALKKIATVVALFSPLMAYSATSATFGDVVSKVTATIALLIPVLIGVALAYFIYGVVKFISAGADGKKEAKDTIIYGIVGLFAIVSVWGLVKLLQTTFNITPTERITIPKI